MVTIREYPNTNVFEFQVDGKITKEDFEGVVEKLDPLIEEYGTVKLIEVVKNIGTIEPSALWADLKWTPRHIKSFSHIAVVSDEKWIERIAGPLTKFIPGEVRLFHLDELEEARAWIASERAAV